MNMKNILSIIFVFLSFASFGQLRTTGTGTGNLVFSTSPTLTTPSLGVATATSINGNTFTTGTYTLTGVSGKTFTFNKSITIDGTDGTTMTFPATSKTLAANDGSNLTIASQAIGDLLVASSTTAYGRLAAVATGSFLRSAGTGTAPIWSTLTIPNAATTGDVIVATGTNALGVVAAQATANKVLLSGASAVPTWSAYTFAGTASQVYTFPTTTATIARTDAANTFTGTQTFSGAIVTAAGTTGLTPINIPTASVLRTSSSAGDIEFDNKNLYFTPEATMGRGYVPDIQRFRLTANGSTISTISNFFGATSNPTLVSGAEYLIEIDLYYTNTTAGTVTWTFTNSAAPTSQNIHTIFSPVGGILAPAGSAAATYLIGDIQGDATAAKALTTSGTLTDATTQYAHFSIHLFNNTGVSLKIQATKLVGGTITPLKGSYWTCTRVPSTNTGTFVN